ncbi:tetratricopeptide repeat protein [Pontiellaceae bacterium B12227]|nr:tetratricopeptide repeat protein [Pontiellaceae bacterium B12227]
MMNMSRFILTAYLASLALAGAAANKKQSAQTYYDRGMTVFKVDPGASQGLFNKAAKLGHVDAMIRLGHCYQTGTGVPPGLKSALHWYTQAVNAGSTAPLYEIGVLHETGNSKIPPDYAQAIEWYEKGISNSSLKSCEALARIYASCPDSTFHDGAKAIQYATLLVQNGKNNPVSFDLLAAAHARDNNFPSARKAASTAITLSSLEDAPARRERKTSYEQGIPYPATASNAWILKAAATDNTWAMLKLANLYGDELSDSYDPALARNWFKKAAENGNAEALLKMGQLYFHGRGGEVDLEKAFWYLSEAAEAGNENAYAPLARMYVGGKGTRADAAVALEWYQKSIDAGHRINSSKINALKYSLRKDQQKTPEEFYEQARRIIANKKPDQKGELPTFKGKTSMVHSLYWLAAEHGLTDAMKELGDMYFYGKRYFVRDGELDKTTGGLDSNYVRALDYYEQLAHKNIQCPELEPCKELYLIQLQEQRERQLKKEMDARRAAQRSTRKKF